MSRLKDTYKNEIVDAMTKKFGYKNIMEVPKLDKIVINMGVGEAKENAKILEAAVKDLETISGQKAVLTRAKNSVANFIPKPSPGRLATIFIVPCVALCGYLSFLSCYRQPTRSSFVPQAVVGDF